MKKILGRILLGLLVVAAVVYLCDWGVWGIRRARGEGMETVQVTWFQVAELKGGREQMYPDGEGPVSCSDSLFPHGAGNPCWYVKKHPVVLER